VRKERRTARRDFVTSIQITVREEPRISGVRGIRRATAFFALEGTAYKDLTSSRLDRQPDSRTRKALLAHSFERSKRRESRCLGGRRYRQPFRPGAKDPGLLCADPQPRQEHCNVRDNSRRMKSAKKPRKTPGILATSPVPQTRHNQNSCSRGTNREICYSIETTLGEPKSPAWSDVRRVREGEQTCTGRAHPAHVGSDRSFRCTAADRFPQGLPIFRSTLPTRPTVSASRAASAT
jgi:hypothetical protein